MFDLMFKYQLLQNVSGAIRTAGGVLTTAVVTSELVITVLIRVSKDTTFGADFGMGTGVIGMAVSLAIKTSPRSWNEDSDSKNKGTDLNRGGEVRSVKGDSIEIGVFDAV